jgi:4-hydroxybenzoate polyprenyltransferase
MDSDDSPRSVVVNRAAVYLEMIKFQHSIFALPFAYLGAFLSEKRVPSFTVLFWITLAMAGARSFAMALNRIIDMEIDRKNPRTADRALPKGLISVRKTLVFSLGSLALFLLAVYNLAPVCRYLWPFVIIPFVIYPYTKRFTFLSHFILGLCLGLAPVGAWIAVTNTYSIEPFLFGGAVLLWVAGFDILYAVQDIHFDRNHGLHSVPARFGIKASLLLTIILHAGSILLLLLAGIMLELGLFYFAGVLTAAVLLAYENSLIKPDDLSRLNMAFFSMNGIIAGVMFFFAVLEVVIGRVGIG